MTKYSENPNLNLRVVTTVQGDKEYRRNCRSIKEAFYVIGRDCFEIDGRFYRKESPNIAYDSTAKEWIKIEEVEKRKLTQGLVSFNAETNKFEQGYFKLNPYVACRVRSGSGTYLFHDVNELDPNLFIENVATGVFHRSNTLGAKNIRIIRNETSFTNRGYNIEDNPNDFNNKLALFEKYDTPVSAQAKKFGSMLGETSVGAEIEISAGYVDEYLQNRTGIVICRDGSIGGGPELVTVPMRGVKAPANLAYISELLETRGNVDIHCSFHLHLGTIPTTKMFIAAVYQLGLNIQDELFQMFPYYKTDHTGIKKKNYNQKLPSFRIGKLVDDTKEGFESYIGEYYERIFELLTAGSQDRIPNYRYNRKTREHPIRQKWNREGR